MVAVLTDKPRLCRTCGTRYLAAHARYTRWTECSVCYWKHRYESGESISDLQRSNFEIQQRITAITTELPKAKKALEDYEKQLHKTTPWFKRLFGLPADSTLESYKQQYYALYSEESLLRSKLKHIPFAIERARIAKKRFTEAQLARTAADRRHRQQQQKDAEFADRSAVGIGNPFDRSHFYIQPKDYRRGNAIDNYCRKTLGDAILVAFGHCCAFCGCNHDVTV